jgi:hypothetical protein
MIDKEKENLYKLLDEVLSMIESGISTDIIKQCNGYELSWMHQARKAIEKWNGKKLSVTIKATMDNVNERKKDHA